ncbi:hypothetical protein Acr_27g0001410 [Actinidia rufa]|uniref:Uncharacterized protein n=1 Tax=Actinidia rufa TaxID=165716 RepID=A0A7J0H5Q3_9ERIC|nr:hypothetical protein Acr_27g0001410 [Actinidia rufa]
MEDSLGGWGWGGGGDLTPPAFILMPIPSKFEPQFMNAASKNRQVSLYLWVAHHSCGLRLKKQVPKTLSSSKAKQLEDTRHDPEMCHARVTYKRPQRPALQRHEAGSFVAQYSRLSLAAPASPFKNLGEQPTVNIARSILLDLLGTGPRTIKGRPAQTNRNKGPGRGRSKPLRRDDQTKAMTADGVMGRVHGPRRDPRKDEYGKISRRYRRHNWKDCHLETQWRQLGEVPWARLTSVKRVRKIAFGILMWRWNFIGLMSGDVHCLPWGERLKLSDLAKVVGQKAATSASKGVVISEGSETTSGKRALDDGSKGKQVAQLPESKKAKIDTRASEAPARPPIASGGVVRGQGEGGQAHLRSGGDQVSPCARPGSSLAVCSRDLAECALNQKAVAESAEMEMVRAQNRAIELEGALAEEKAKGKKLAEDADARDKVIARLEARISDLEKSQSFTQGRIIAAFKESDDFLEAVRGSASSYFGDGFDFCKRQLAHQYPDLGVDLEDVEMDHEFLAKEEAEAKKREAEEGADGVEGVGEAVV